MEQLDYAPHYLEAKKNLTKIHNLLNNHRHVDAASLIDQTIVELRLMRTAVKSQIKENNG